MSKSCDAARTNKGNEASSHASMADRLGGRLDGGSVGSQTIALTIADDRWAHAKNWTAESTADSSAERRV